MGLLEKALEIEQQSGGLLNAAQALTRATDHEKKKSDSLDSALRALEGISETADPVPTIFESLREALSISKGAVLIFDPGQHTYAPRATCGFDRTTENRLRVPETVAQDNEIMLTGNPIRLSGDGLEQFRQFFSMREFDQLESLSLFPLIVDNDLHGILLIAAASALPDESSWEGLLERVTGIIKLSRSAARVETPLPALDDEVDLDGELDRLIKSALAREKAVIVFRIAIQEAVAYLSKLSPRVEQYQIRQDIVRILSSLVSGIGLVAPQSEAILILAVTTRKTMSSKLFAHQITQSVRTFFRNAEEKLPLVMEPSLRYPDDGASARAILSRWE
jgi:hypothetical protein